MSKSRLAFALPLPPSYPFVVFNDINKRNGLLIYTCGHKLICACFIFGLFTKKEKLKLMEEL